MAGRGTLKTHREIGKTGVSVFPIALGTLFFRETAVLRAAIDSGLELIDTADVYQNEEWLGKTLARIPGRSHVRIATKGGLDGGGPRHLRRACEQSLKFLRRDSIFLYQLHRPDPKIDLTESVGALLRLREEGKIEHIGVSNVTPAQLKKAMRVAEIATVQNFCGPLHPLDLKNGMIEFCETNRITYLAYGPFGGRTLHGLLPEDPLLARLSKKYGASPYPIVLAWLLAQSPRIIPLLGTTKVEHLRKNLRGASLQLSTPDLRRLNQART